MTQECWWENGFVWQLDSSDRNCNGRSCCMSVIGWFEMTVIGIERPSMLRFSIGALRSWIEVPHHCFYYLFARRFEEMANAGLLNNPTPYFWVALITVETLPEHLYASRHLSAISLFLLEAMLSMMYRLVLSIRIYWFALHNPCYSSQSSQFDATSAI